MAGRDEQELAEVGLLAQVLDHLQAIEDELGGPPLRFARIRASAAGDTTVVGDSVGRIQVVSYVLVSKAAVDVIWKSGGREISGTLGFGAGGGAAPVSGSRRNPVLECDPGEELVLNLSGAVTIGGHLTYVDALVRE